MPNLRITTTLNSSQWSSFVYNHPNGNVFQTPEMYEVYKNTKNYEPVFLAVLDENDEPDCNYIGYVDYSIWLYIPVLDAEHQPH